MSPKNTPLPQFIRTMTPEKFKAMSKEAQRAYRQKSNEWFAKLDAKIDQANAENHKKLAYGIAELIYQNPLIEWEIVQSYLVRTDQLLISQDFYNNHPEVARALAAYQAEKMSRPNKAPKRAK